MGKSRRLILVLAATAVLAVVTSGCVGYKPGSFSVGQVNGIGPVKFHLELCSAEGKTTALGCGPNDESGQAQSILGFIVPIGSVAPATLTAVPGEGATPIHYNRNDELAAAVTSEELPPGLELVGYLSDVYSEKAGDTFEWSVDAEFGLPTPADGGSFAGTFKTSGIVGWRVVDGSNPPNRPIVCTQAEPSGTILSGCTSTGEYVEYGVSNLVVKPPATVSAYAGAKATLPFSLDFASTVSPPPTFTLAAGSTLPKAVVNLPEPSFAGGPPDPTTHRSPLATRNVKVTVPANAKPGTYDVTITATASTGGVVTQVAKLQVTKPVIKFVGKPKLNKAKGTAILTVKVPGAGTLTASGKGVVKAQKKPKKAGKVKLTIRAKGGALNKLRADGSVKLKPQLKFKPSDGAAVTKTKPVTLRLS